VVLFLHTQRASFQWRRLIGRLALLPLLGLWPAMGWADSDNPKAAEPPELRRQLDGHVFIFTENQLDPFVSTYVLSQTGFGYGTAAGYTYDVAGKPVTLANYQVGGFAQQLAFQYGFLDWWAVRINTVLTVYSGINGSGAAAVGTNALATVGLGTTLSWKVGDSLRLGGSLDFQFGPSVFFNILKAVQDSIESGDISTPVISAGSYSLVPAFVGAWAIEPWVGFTFAVSYKYSNATTSNSVNGVTNSVSLLNLGGVFDFDLDPACRVPIGFLAGLQTTFSANKTRFTQFRWQGGIFYTGVKPLTVGLEIDYNRAPVVGATQTFLSSLLGLIVLQYNFN